MKITNKELYEVYFEQPSPDGSIKFDRFNKKLFTDRKEAYIYFKKLCDDFRDEIANEDDLDEECRVILTDWKKDFVVEIKTFDDILNDMEDEKEDKENEKRL